MPQLLLGLRAAGVLAAWRRMPDNRGVGSVNAALVEHFLAGGGTHLLLLDSDMAVGPGVIREAVLDFESLWQTAPPNRCIRGGPFVAGALAQYDLWRSRLGRVHARTPYGVFRAMRVGGEGCFLTNRRVLEVCGDALGPGRVSTADEFWLAIAQRGDGWYLACREPLPRVQHLGAWLSAIHRDTPRYARRWLADWPCQSRPIEVPGLDRDALAGARHADWAMAAWAAELWRTDPCASSSDSGGDCAASVKHLLSL